VKRVAALAALVVATSTGGTARAQLSPLQLFGRDANDSVHVDAYLGVDYTEVSRQNESFGVRGLSREPYVLKTGNFEITNLSGFDFALNAAATSLLAVGGFTKPADTSSNVDTSQAERYAALLRYALGKKVKIRTEAQFARMATYVAPNSTYNSAYPVTTYYSPQGGGLERMHPGDGIGGNTNWYQAAILFETSDRILGISGAFGYRILQLDTLSPYGVKNSNSVPVFQSLVEDRFLCQALTVDTNRPTELFLDVVAHLNLGYASVSSAFVNTAGGMCVGVGGVVTLVYDQPHWSLTVGVAFDELVAVTFAGGSTLSQNVAYNNPSTSRVLNASAGTKWNVSGPAESIDALGPFMHLTAHF
jgi:hypothetical protein